MTYRLRNISIAIALALVAALLTSFYVANFQKNVRKEEANVLVYVAAKDIPIGTPGADVAKKGMLKKSEVARRTIVPGTIAEPSQLENLVSTQPIFAGEQVSTRRFATPSERGIGAQLKGTMRAFQLAGDEHQLLAGTLKTGDRVDVVASLKPNPDRDYWLTRVILRDIEVLKAAATPGTAEKISEAKSSESVLVAVTDTQIQKLFHASKHGSWSLELRPPLKANDSPETIHDSLSILRDGLRTSQLDRIAPQAGGE